MIPNGAKVIIGNKYARRFYYDKASGKEGIIEYSCKGDFGDLTGDYLSYRVRCPGAGMSVYVHEDDVHPLEMNNKSCAGMLDNEY